MADELRDRLRRLRRELAPASPAAPPRDALPGWFHARASRRASTQDRGVPPREQSAATTSVGDPTELTELESELGVHAARVLRLDRDARHGAWRLDEFLDARGGDLAFLTGDRALADWRGERASFLDIETTGLSGGAGTAVFLIALGRFDARGFELWQGFARGPDEEAALLSSCAARVRESDALVTFFGKSFDRHRLQDKMRVHGIAPPFEGRPHLDLYHPCRRLYGAALADARLATLERELCGVERERDLPGAFAPAAWFDYLAGRAHKLEQVFAHNRDDALSLVTLGAHVACARRGRRGDGSELAGPAPARDLALAKLESAAGDARRALELVERLDAASRASPPAIELRAGALRALERPREALEAWLELARREDAAGARASLEAAKLAARLADDRAAELAARARRLASRTLAGLACVRVERAATRLLARVQRAATR